MSLLQWSEVLGNAGEFLGSIAVLVTLVYLAIQVREANRQSVFAAVQANRAERRAYFTALRDSPSMPAITRKILAGEALSPEEEERYGHHCALWWSLFYSEWASRQIGLTGEFVTSDAINLDALAVNPRMLRWFGEAGRRIYPRRFSDYIDAQMAVRRGDGFAPPIGARIL
jgi:hypothetical protein